MKLSCLPVSYFPQIIAGQMSAHQWAGKAASLGLDGEEGSKLGHNGVAAATRFVRETWAQAKA